MRSRMIDVERDRISPLERGGIAWRATWPVMMAVLLFFALAIYKEAVFPSRMITEPAPISPETLELLRKDLLPARQGWIDFLILVVIPVFMLVKVEIMIRRISRDEQGRIDWLAISLIYTNLTFVGLYTLAVSSILYPYWFATHPHVNQVALNALRMCLSTSLLWSTALLIYVPGRDIVRFRWVHERVGPLVLAASIWVLAWVAFDGLAKVAALAVICLASLGSLLVSFRMRDRNPYGEFE